MQLSDFSHRVHDQLAASAALGDDRTREIAATLSAVTQSAVRLTVLDALSAASLDLNAALQDAAGGPSGLAVTVQLDGDEVRFVLSGPPAEATEPPRGDDGEATARISLRLAEALKAEIEHAAGHAETSVNNWLVKAASAALRTGPAGWRAGESWPDSRSSRGAHRITGWVGG